MIMWSLPRRVWSTLGDATVGTAIVMVHVLLSDRERQRVMARPRERRGDRGVEPRRDDVTH